MSPSLRPEHEMTGKSIGCLRIESRAANNVHGNAQWNCTCALCGRTHIILGSYLRGRVLGYQVCSRACLRDLTSVARILRERDPQLFSELISEGSK